MTPLLSVEQAAGALGLSVWTVRSWVRSGKLASVRLGRRVLLEESELERFIHESRCSSQNPTNAEEMGHVCD
jgi:excisionase family DNA binding protein